MKQVKVNAMSYALLIKALQDAPQNCRELAEITGLHYVTVLLYVRELHAAGACRIAAWEKDAQGRDCVKVYRLGAGRDAKRQRKTLADRRADYAIKKARAPGVTLAQVWA